MPVVTRSSQPSVDMGNKKTSIHELESTFKPFQAKRSFWHKLRPFIWKIRNEGMFCDEKNSIQKLETRYRLLTERIMGRNSDSEYFSPTPKRGSRTIRLEAEAAWVSDRLGALYGLREQTVSQLFYLDNASWHFGRSGQPIKSAQTDVKRLEVWASLNYAVMSEEGVFDVLDFVNHIANHAAILFGQLGLHEMSGKMYEKSIEIMNLMAQYGQKADILKLAWVTRCAGMEYTLAGLDKGKHLEQSGRKLDNSPQASLIRAKSWVEKIKLKAPYACRHALDLVNDAIAGATEDSLKSEAMNLKDLILELAPQCAMPFKDPALAKEPPLFLN